MGLPPDDAVVADALRSVEMFFHVAERRLHHRDYRAGNDFTLVDIYDVSLIQRLFACGYGDSRRQSRSCECLVGSLRELAGHTEDVGR